MGEPRQVSGYKVEYEGLTFATIKGAGHMVGGRGGCDGGWVEDERRLMRGG